MTAPRVPVVEERIDVVEMNLAKIARLLYDVSINIAGERLGLDEDAKDTPEVVRLKALSITALKKRDYFEGELEKLKAEKENSAVAYKEGQI